MKAKPVFSKLAFGLILAQVAYEQPAMASLSADSSKTWDDKLATAKPEGTLVFSKLSFPTDPALREKAESLAKDMITKGLLYVTDQGQIAISTSVFQILKDYGDVQETDQTELALNCDTPVQCGGDGG
ncbi:MAG: hypothetical protein ACOYOK_02110 [Pseudobdellovibrionaceae bacterium]